MSVKVPENLRTNPQVLQLLRRIELDTYLLELLVEKLREVQGNPLDGGFHPAEEIEPANPYLQDPNFADV